MQQAIRAEICHKCYQRPPGSENLGPNVPRSCEPTCALFRSLPGVVRIAKQQQDDVRSPFEAAMRDQICSECQLSPSAGDYCADHLGRTCPLSRYARDTIEVLERIIERPARR